MNMDGTWSVELLGAFLMVRESFLTLMPFKEDKQNDAGSYSARMPPEAPPPSP